MECGGRRSGRGVAGRAGGALTSPAPGPPRGLERHDGGRTAAAAGLGTAVHHRPQGNSADAVRSFTGVGAATIKYTLDGSETTSRMPGRLCEPDTAAMWTAAWDGQALALTMVGVVPPHGKPVKADVKSTLRLEGTDTLRVESRHASPVRPSRE